MITLSKNKQIICIILLMGLIFTLLEVPDLLAIETATHFQFHESYNSVFFWGTAKVCNLDVEAGDELGIFAPSVSVNDGCIGAAVLTVDGYYQSIPAYEDDPLTQEKDGAISGDTLTFRLWKKSESKYYDLKADGPDDPSWTISGEVLNVNVSTSLSPIANFNLNADNLCAFTQIFFSDLSANDPAAWDWDFGDNSEHNFEQNPSHIYAKPGAYTVTLTVTNPCGSHSKSLNIAINYEPIALFLVDTKQGLAPLSINLKNRSIGQVTSLTWNFGDGNSLSLTSDFSQDRIYTYHAPGTYSLSLTATNDCGTDTIITHIYVYTTPKGSLTGRVTDKTGEYLAGAQVTIPGIGETTTAVDGIYEFEDIPEGEYRINISKTGYQTLITSGVKIAAGKGSSYNVRLETMVGSISGKVLKGSSDQDPNSPIEGAEVTALTMSGASQGFDTKTDQDGCFIIYLPSGTYKVIASAKAYEPAMDSNQSFGYDIDPNITIEGISFRLEPKPNGPQLRGSSLEWDADPNTSTINNKTRIMIFIDSNTPLSSAPHVQLDPNIMGTNPVGNIAPNPAKLITETIVAGRVIKEHYETVYFDYAGTEINKAGIRITASDPDGLTDLTYVFEVDSNTIAGDVIGPQDGNNEGGTSLQIIPAEGGKTGTIGLIDTDNDGIVDDYDESFIDVLPCALIGGNQGIADPFFDELSRLFIRIERVTPQGENTFTAHYDIQILDEKGNKAANVQINKSRPVTVYLQFDPARFDRNLSNVVIKYFDSNSGEWKSDGIKNIRISGNAIVFEVEHVTVFGAFSSKPAKLSAIGSDGKITLTWEDNSTNETGFEIYRKVDIDGNFSLYETLDADIITYNDSGCTEGKAYYYMVRAVTPFGLTDFSNEAGATIIPQTVQKPADPTNLNITKKSDTEIELTWQDNSDNENGFRIYRKALYEANYSLIGTTGANITIFKNPGLAQNETYTYYVIAYNSAGDSEKSNIESYTVPEKTKYTLTDDGLCFISTIKAFGASAIKQVNIYFNKVILLLIKPAWAEELSNQYRKTNSAMFIWGEARIKGASVEKGDMIVAVTEGVKVQEQEIKSTSRL